MPTEDLGGSRGGKHNQKILYDIKFFIKKKSAPKAPSLISCHIRDSPEVKSFSLWKLLWKWKEDRKWCRKILQMYHFPSAEERLGQLSSWPRLGMTQWRGESRESVFSEVRLSQELFPDFNSLFSRGLNILNPFIHSLMHSLIQSFILSTNKYLVPSIGQTLTYHLFSEWISDW